MATRLARLQGRTAKESSIETVSGVDLITPEEGRALFDRRARKLLNMSGEEFLRRWDAGEYRAIPDGPEGHKVGELVMMMPFARRTNS